MKMSLLVCRKNVQRNDVYSKLRIDKMLTIMATYQTLEQRKKTLSIGLSLKNERN